MSEAAYTTIGREIYPGREVKLSCVRDADQLGPERVAERFRIVYVKAGCGVFQNGENSQIVTAPSVLCLNAEDAAKLHSPTGFTLDILFFEPSVFERYIAFDSIADWRSKLAEDAFFFSAFFERDAAYIGASATNHYLGNRIAQLIRLTDELLTGQKDDFWPCRSRSYFIELLLLVNSVYREDETHERIFTGKMTDEIREVADWLQVHYLEKLVLEDITKQFNTNKTTLNQRFKAVMGVTVMEYVMNLRMQIACSLLRKTYLSVNEIMERAGYRDDAHFLRAFKKYAGCTPTEYRSRYEIAG
ncbi:MAG: AraC family transcriptional regulator [Eubacteriales bacterium]|nr:AraC family transcriptional regulator [Eubacteriales bacterium]